MVWKLTFPMAITAIVTGTAVAYRSPAFAACAVGLLAVELVAEIVKEKVFAMKNITLTLSEPDRRKQQELEARIAAVEAGIARRGF